MKLKHGLLCGVLLASGTVIATPPVLTWSPSGNTVWDAVSENWMEGGTRTAWKQGAVAAFDGAGGLVEVSADVSASGLAFNTDGYALVGGGRIRLEGDLFVAAGMTNSVGTELFSAGGIAKKGDGAVALGLCVGRVTVESGDLLAVASTFADAQVSVESGARLVTGGEPAREQNLLLNGSFEAFAMNPGTWAYVSAGANLTEWGVAVSSNRVGGQNLSVAGSPWNSAGAAPHGDHVLILQYEGSVTQAVEVVEAGWYQVGLSHFLRNDYPDTAFYVTLGGVTLAAVFNDAQEFHAKRFVSVPLWLEEGTYTLGIAGERYFADRASMIDDVVLAPAFTDARPCRALGGESSVALAAGAEAVLNHDGNLGIAQLADANAGATLSGGGVWSEALTGFWFDYAGGVWNPALDMGEDALLRVRDSDNALETEGLARRVWVSEAAAGVTLTGEGLVLTNTVAGRMPRFTVSDASTVRVTAPLFASPRTIVDVYDGLLSLESDVTFTNRLLSKRGFGELSVTSAYHIAWNASVLEGRLRVGEIPSGTGGGIGSGNVTGNTGYLFLMPLPGREAELCLTATNNTIFATVFGGRGRSVVSTDLGGGTLQAQGNPRTQTAFPAEFNVTGSDTLSIRQLLVRSSGNDFGGDLLKTGPGTLEIREGGLDTGDNRAHSGRVVLRNGTLRVLTDDTGPYAGSLAYNGTSLDGRGGSLGRSPLTNAVWIGDAETLRTDDLTFIAVGNRRYIGHDFEVFDVGNDVRFETENSTDTMFAGTFFLHRNVTFAGDNDAYLTLGAVVSAAGANLAFEGFSRIMVTDTLDGDINLDVGDRTLAFGAGTATVSTISSLTVGDGVLEVYVGGGQCSRIDAADITLGTTAFNLYYQGTDRVFAEPGTYTLLTSTGTMTVNTQDLSVANEVPGFDYVFGVLGDALTLTITPTVPGTFTVWVSPQSGKWDTGGNWNPAGAPDNSTLEVLLGAAITENATVTLENPFSVGSLFFNNLQWGYTLEGDTLTFGSPARLDVLNGSHTVKNTLAATDPLSITVSGGKLTLDGQAVIQPPVLLEQGNMALAGEATLAGGVSLADTAALTVSGSDVTVGTGLDGVDGSSVTLQGGTKLTVEQTVAGTFSGLLNGPVDASLIRIGTGAWKLDAYDSFYHGAFHQAAGETALSGASLYGAVTADAGTKLTVTPAVSDGLMGYYYRGNPTPSTNAFLSVAGLEAFVAGRTPDLISLSSLDGATFDYPMASGTSVAFPYPFGKGGPNTENFTVVWRGSILLSETGSYSFALRADDYPLVAIDGKVLFSNNRYEAVTYYTTAEFTAGRHDILIALGQAAGSTGIQMYVSPPSDEVNKLHIALPNSWLSPMTTLGSLNGEGLVTVQDGAGAIVGMAGTSKTDGALNTAADTLLTKMGNSLLDIRNSAANQIEGDVTIRNGRLHLARPGVMGTASRVAVCEAALFATQASQAIGGLEGAGPALVGSLDPAGIDVFEFTDETDSGISPMKVYTHRVSFPTTAAGATVNGVPFDTGNTNFEWVFGAPNNNIQGGANVTSIERLLYSFLYNSQDCTFRLTGLQPFTAHEFRFYFRSWNNNFTSIRDVTLTLTAGANVVGSTVYNIDSVAYSQVRCRYVTDAAGTLDVRVQSGSNTAHLYAFSNEVLGGDTFDSSDAALTLAPAAADDLLYAGTLSGNGAVVKDGGGIQRFAGVNITGGGLTVLDGEAVLNPGASVSNGVSIAAGATATVPLGAVTLGGLTGGGTLDMPGAGSRGYQRGAYIHTFTNDASSLISQEKDALGLYTHKLDFGTRANTTIGQNGATVNDVTFLKAGTSGTSGGYGWDGFVQAHPGGAIPSPAVIANTEGMYALLTDMVYNNLADSVATLTGLIPGKTYEVRFYNRWWEANKDRSQTVRFVPDPAVTNTVSFNPDALTPHFLAYRYTPTSGTLSIIFGPEGAATWHIYALTNEEVDGQDDLGGNISTPFVASLGDYPEETLYQHFFTDDSTCQISPTKVYTHKLDFGVRGSITPGNPGAVVNGVQFIKARERGGVVSNHRTYGWQGFGNLPSGPSGGNDDNNGLIRSQGIYDLMKDMVYNTANGTALLTGLEPGKEYEVRIYNRMWTYGANGRPQTVRFIADPAVTNTITFFEDRLSAHFLAYRYTAPSSGTLTITYTANTADTWHIYALTNEEVHRQPGNPVVLDIDGYDTFAGNVTGPQDWEKRGPGTLLMTGYSTAQGLLTVNGGAFGVGQDGIATLGPVLVQDGSLLFGHGTFGGAVDIADGAALHAGTEAACGTLAIGGHLTIADNAELRWRYASKSEADTFTVGGLTLPSAGTLYAAPIAPNAAVPGKHILFTSATPINGPADLTDWVVDGIKDARLDYNANRTQIILRASRGTVLIIK